MVLEVNGMVHEVLCSSDFEDPSNAGSGRWKVGMCRSWRTRRIELTNLWQYSIYRTMISAWS